MIHEDRVKIGKANKAPDYSFRLPGGKRLFFVEAKKPSVMVRLDTSVAYQIRRYGWSARLAVSISLRNKELDEDEINYAVQLTIDRLIFLRIAEDREIEPTDSSGLP